jgi:hypothetical protein
MTSTGRLLTGGFKESSRDSHRDAVSEEGMTFMCEAVRYAAVRLECDLE